MTDLCLYHTPGACSRVSMNALEEANAAYVDHAVNIFKGEQHTPEYRSINSKGNVPALIVGQRLLTETPAILLYLDTRFPQAGLFPSTEDSLSRIQNVSDLIWISSGLHPISRTIFMPSRVSPTNPSEVRTLAADQLGALLPDINKRLAAGWWHGENWSITDVYLSWSLGLAHAGGYDFSAWPEIIAHGDMVRARASFQRALAREQAALAAACIELPTGAKL